MKRRLLSGLVLMLAIAGVWADLQGQEVDLKGTWTGALTIGPNRLRLVVDIERNATGAYGATMASPDQGARDIPVASVVIAGDSVRMDVPAVGGRFAGELQPGGQAIEGTWSQGAGSLPLRLERGAPVGPNRPQEPVPPFPYRSEEVRIQNASAAGVTLAGTLTLPERDAPFPAVVLVSGSGPQDRDESILGHKPFLVLADYLTRRGIAVLRYDDRGVAASTGSFATATSEDFAGDAVAAVELLRSRSDIARDRIGIIGHSEGGLIAPMAANRSDAVAFVVLMAGPGLTGEQILLLQQERIMRAANASPEALASNRAMQERIFAILREEQDSEVARSRIAAMLTDAVGRLAPAERAQAGIDAAGGAEAFAQAQAAQVTSPWFRFFVEYDPAPALRALTVPVLAITGERDLQVPARENLAAIRAALEQGGNADFTLAPMPGLNHLMQESVTGSPVEYATIEQTMSEAALEMMAKWILERFAR
jgi:uncharacterized protein